MQEESALTIPAGNNSSHSALDVGAAAMAIAIMAMVLCFDMLAGPLRYYLSRVGLESLIYAPKAACLLFVGLEIFRGRVSRSLFYVAVMVAAYAVVGLVHQAGVSSILFSIFLISPFLLGMAAARYLHDRERAFVLLLAVVFLVTALGVYLDIFLELPWKGFTYKIGGADIEGSREWVSWGVKRAAGFTRMSAVAAFYLTCSGLFLYAYSRSWWPKLLVTVIAFPAILVTTNKAGMGGFVLGLASTLLFGFPRALKLSVYGLALTVMILPVSTVLRSYDLDLNDPLSLLLFSSFEGRLSETWPSFIAGVSKFGNPFTGVGFGGIGAAVQYFAGDNRAIFTYADNFSLYLYGCFGIAAVAVFLYLARVTVRLFASRGRLKRSLAPVMVALLAASLTTDVIEAQVFALMLGIGIAFKSDGLQPSGATGEVI